MVAACYVLRNPIGSQVLADMKHPTNEVDYRLGVSTIQDIRRANLKFLLQEVEAEIGRTYGSAAELSRRTQVAAPFISQFLRREVHQGGTERTMGDKQARKLERGMGKPDGWMDVDRTVAADWQEAALLDKLRQLNEAQRLAVSTVVDQLLSGNSTPKG